MDTWERGEKMGKLGEITEKIGKHIYFKKHASIAKIGNIWRTWKTYWNKLGEFIETAEIVQSYLISKG